MRLLSIAMSTYYSLVVFEQIPSVDESPATDISLEWILAGYVYASAYHMSWVWRCCVSTSGC